MLSPAISVKNLVKIFAHGSGKPFHAVDGISFEVKRGEIFGLLGPNGAGKSTTIKILTTLLQPSAGTAAVNGFDVVSDADNVRNSICVVIQENAVDTFLTVKNNFYTFGKFHGLTRSETERRMHRLSELFGLQETLAQRAMDLSGGMKRRMQVAKMFLVDTPVVFLDEATTGMDTFNKRTTIAAIKEESKRGRTIVLTTHMLDEAEELCDAVAIVNRGKIIAEGTTSEVKEMGLEMYSLSLRVKEVSAELRDEIARLKPLEAEINGKSIELKLRDHDTALKILSFLSSRSVLVNFEMTSSSLEDVFVALLDKQKEKQR